MKPGVAVVVGSVAVVVLLPLVVLWFTRRQRSGAKDTMDEKQQVRKKKVKIAKTTTIKKEDVRFVIGKHGVVIKEIESRCGVRICFPENDSDNNPDKSGSIGSLEKSDSVGSPDKRDMPCDKSLETYEAVFSSIDIREDANDQIVSVSGDCVGDIAEAVDMIHEACQLKPVIINETIEIRSEYCGKIIGKGGENLRTIKEFSGTRVHISKEAYRGDDDIRLCTIEGTKGEIEVAKELIHSNIMTEIEIRRRREHKQVIKDFKPYAAVPLDSVITEESVDAKHDLTTVKSSHDNQKCGISSSGMESVETGDSQQIEQTTCTQIESHTCSLSENTSFEQAVQLPLLVPDIRSVQNEAVLHPDITDISTNITDISTNITDITTADISTAAVTPIKLNDIMTDIVKDIADNQCTSFEPLPLLDKVKGLEPVIELEPCEKRDDQETEQILKASDSMSGISEFSTLSSDELESKTSTESVDLDSKTSTEFTVNSSYDEVSSVSDTAFDTVRTDMRIDEDVHYMVEVREGSTPGPLLSSVCLPPLTRPLPYDTTQEHGSESVETLVANNPPSSLISSKNSLIDSRSNMSQGTPGDLVNRKLTHDLKSMLGIAAADGDVTPKKTRIENAGEEKSEQSNEATEDHHSLNYCNVYKCYNPFPEIPEFVDEFTGHVTAADCACHVWVVRRDSNTLIASKLTSSVHTDVADRIELNKRYMFVDYTSDTKARACTLAWVSRAVVECCDMDTGIHFCAPISSLYELPTDISSLPAEAVCVSVGSFPCSKVKDSDLIGKVFTVNKENMGANKEAKYPRVTLHCDQIVYTNYRPFVSSPKSSDTTCLPHSSSLVYVSAIHNAGHFYVQVCGKNISDLDHLETAMAEHYGSVDNLPNYSWDPIPGQLCAVWHTAEKIWLRGQIKELDNSEMLYIKYLDYGDTVHTPRSYTRKLRTEFKEVPYQAIECFLANTIPITTRQWTPEATAKFDALTQCGQWYPLRCVVVGERHGKPCVELYDHPYSDKEYSVAECLCVMEFARSSKLEIPAVQTLSTPIPSFASGAAYLVSPDFDDVDDELEELFACNDDSDSADSDDFPLSRANVSNILMSLSNQISPGDRSRYTHSKHRPQTCGAAKNNAFMERKNSVKAASEQTSPEIKSRCSTQDSENLSESEQGKEFSKIEGTEPHGRTRKCRGSLPPGTSNFYDTPGGSNTPKSTTSSYESAEFTFVAPTETPHYSTPLHLSSAEDTDCG